MIDRNKEIIELYTSGNTLEAIGKIYGISRERVRQILKKAGITAKDGGRAVYQKYAVNIDEAIRLRKQGLTLKHISDILGVSYSLLHKSVDLSSIKLRPEGMRYCGKCDKYFEESAFYKMKNGQGGYAYRHKPCHNKYQNERNRRIKNEQIQGKTTCAS